ASGDSAGGPRPVRGACAPRPKARFPVVSISRPSALSPVLLAARNGGGRTMSRFRKKWNRLFQVIH
ncbi:MAG: hypothetical protein OXC66_12945, partial [Roseovarius sp.]|nr:hypothetical protein [Roseovarius sp.]